MKNFHKKYTKISPWWRFIRQEFQLNKGEKYQINIGVYGLCYVDKYISLEKNGTLTIYEGFKWGASGPTIDTYNTREASLVHDAAYHLSKKGVFRGSHSRHIKSIVDRLLYTILLQNGCWEWRANMWLNAVNVLGWTSWEK